MKKKLGRPPVYDMPDLIPDTPENVARIFMGSPTVPTGGWLCLLFIHPRAPNLINLRSASTMPA